MTLDARHDAPWGPTDASIVELLAARAARDPDWIYCRTLSPDAPSRTTTIADLDRMSGRIAGSLASLGVRAGDRVATMLANGIESFALFFALVKLGAINVPVNVHLRGEGLRHILENAGCTCVVAERQLAEVVEPLAAALRIANVVWSGGSPEDGVALETLAAGMAAPPPPPAVDLDATIYLSYTSGTTGLPKGVMMSDRILRTCAWAAGRLGDFRKGDVLHMWEPTYHIGGAQVLILALQHPVTIGLVPRFSVSRFWREVRELGATHIHFLGGVLAMLLKEPPSPLDRTHGARVAWGGGCPITVWEPFQTRFGLPIRECYGMTECSSFATQNMSGKVGSIGKPLPYFDIGLIDDTGRECSDGERGEIIIREKVPGLLTKGYWNNPAATAATLCDGVLYTGDLGKRDAEGDYYFLGRKKDSIRRRGENVAAFEVERTINQHPDVEECAVLPVPNELVDEDILVVLRTKDGRCLDPLDLIRWCEGKLAYFQIPRFVKFVDEFPKTPSLRIRKELVPRGIDGAWDLEASGHRLRR